MVNFIWFTDEKLFAIAAPSNIQNDGVYAPCDLRKSTSWPLATMSPDVQPVATGVGWCVGAGTYGSAFRRLWTQNQRAALQRRLADSKPAA